MNKKEKTLPLEPRDIERLKERYGKNFNDAYVKGASGTNLGTLIAFSLVFGIFLVIIVMIAVFSNLSDEEIVYIIPLTVFVGFLGIGVFSYIEIAKRTKRYKLMQTVIAQNVKRRITGRASSESITDSKGGFSSYWEVKTDDGTYNFEALECKDGDVVQVDFVTVGSENVVLSSKPIDPTANA